MNISKNSVKRAYNILITHNEQTRILLEKALKENEIIRKKIRYEIEKLDNY